MNTQSLPEDFALLSSRQLRELAGEVSDMTLWRWVKAGIIPKPIKINGRNFWPKHETISSLKNGGVK